MFSVYEKDISNIQQYGFFQSLLFVLPVGASVQNVQESQFQRCSALFKWLAQLTCGFNTFFVCVSLCGLGQTLSFFFLFVIYTGFVQMSPEQTKLVWVLQVIFFFLLLLVLKVKTMPCKGYHNKRDCDCQPYQQVPGFRLLRC